MNLTVVERKTRLIGAIMVERGLLTPSQLREALEAQAERGGLLGEIVIAEFGVSRAEVSHVIAEQLAELEGEPGSETSPGSGIPKLRGATPVHHGHAHLPLGDALVELGLVSREQIDSAHETQRETGERLGDILVGHGVISRLELADALSEHWSSLTKLRAPGVVDGPVDDDVSSVGSAAELEALAGVVNDVVGRLERTVVEHDRELHGRLEGLTSRFDEIAVAHGRNGERLDAIVAAQEAVAGHDPTAAVAELGGRLERLSARLDEFAGGRDGELAARFDGLSSRLEEIAAARESDVSSVGSAAELEALAGVVNDVLGRLDEIAAQGKSVTLVERLDSLDEAQRQGQEVLDRIVDDVAVLQQQTTARLETIAAAQEGLLRREPGAEPEAVSDLIARLEATVADRHRELADQIQRLSAGFEEISALHERADDRLRSLVAVQEAVASQGPPAELEALADQVSALQATIADHDKEISGRLEWLFARLGELGEANVETATGRVGFEQELSTRINGLSARLEELVEAAQADGLVERIASLDEAQRRGERTLSRLLSEVSALREQADATIEECGEQPAAILDLGPQPGDGRKKTKKKKKS